MQKSLLVWIALLVIALAGITAYNQFSRQNIPTACTLEAKICPDGSSVGRTLPNCEFAPCPPTPDSHVASPSTVTPIACSGIPTPTLTEGPYYKTDTPQKTNVREQGIPGEPLSLSGYVLDTNCSPIAGAWLDFWQADGSGNYDNSGYKLRGHQFTDTNGKYTLETVIPGEYPGRTPHVHVKIRASETSPVITSQLFMPGEPKNQSDSIFDESLVMYVTEGVNGKAATFNFVVNK